MRAGGGGGGGRGPRGYTYRRDLVHRGLTTETANERFMRLLTTDHLPWYGETVVFHLTACDEYSMHMTPANAGKPHMSVEKYDNPPVKERIAIDRGSSTLDARIANRVRTCTRMRQG